MSLTRAVLRAKKTTISASTLGPPHSEWLQSVTRQPASVGHQLPSVERQPPSVECQSLLVE